MIRIWNYATYLGLNDKSKSLSNRNIIITNRLNFILIILLLLLNVIMAIIREINQTLYTIHTKKILLILIICIINSVFSYFKKHKITKINLIYFPPLIIVFLPVFFGEVYNIDFVYAPLIIIGLSLIPHIILKPKISNKIYSISLIFFSFQILFLDNLLMYFTHHYLDFFQILNEPVIYYKVVIFSVFIFIQSAMYYLCNLNFKYEYELKRNNKELSSTIDELKITQQQLIQSEKMASLGILTAGVAHEINNPLNYINGGLHIMSEIKNELKECFSEDLKERCEVATHMMSSGFERVSDIVSSLIKITDKGTQKKELSDLNKLIENILLFLNINIPNDITILKKFELNTHVSVYEDKLHQVILTIINNALFALKKENKTGKTIIISTGEKENYAFITIENNGPEIAPEYIHKIFDPFFTTKDPGEGIGLGLYISYNMMKEHKGYIHVQNNDHGVLFEIGIPINA